jgi:hypothetical protein
MSLTHPDTIIIITGKGNAVTLDYDASVIAPADLATGLRAAADHLDPPLVAGAATEASA